MFTIILAAALLGQTPSGCRVINGRMVCPLKPAPLIVEIRYIRRPKPRPAPTLFQRWY